ncbi:MAG: OmpH family outer membrane protein [Flavobacteriales bacterium]|nr:OmpH family outer membrane protein [Flavobacteriales bacterium]
MKKVIIAIAFIGGAVSGFSQKLGHVDGQAILLQMPERTTAEDSIKEISADYQAALDEMGSDREKRVAEIQQNGQTWPEALLQSKMKGVQDLETNMVDFRSQAEEDLAKLEQTLMKPMVDRAKAAIEAVGKEENFTYVFDSSTGTLLYMNGEDITVKVKAKLGIKS